MRKLVVTVLICLCRKENYDEYLEELGVTNVVIYEDKFTTFDPEDEMFNTVSAVLVSPPNTYSAVNDPVELVCSQDAGKSSEVFFSLKLIKLKNAQKYFV